MINSHDILQATSHLPTLNGWRGICIGLVLLSHSERLDGFSETAKNVLYWIPGGNLGVRFFFVISGFLITWLLLKERDERGDVSLLKFYLRRAFRILPAYVVFLVFLFFLNYFGSLSFDTYTWVGLFTYTVNYFETPWVGAHIWSLSVEEQFYLVWPIAFALCVKYRLRPIGILLVAIVPVAFFPMFRVFGHLNGSMFPFNPHSFLCHGDAMAIGCVFAIILRYYPLMFNSIKRFRMPFVFLALLSILIPHVATKLHVWAELTVPFGLTLSSLGFVLLIGNSIIHFRCSVFRLLENRLLAQLGVISYSVYLWQQVFCSHWCELGVEGTGTPFNVAAWIFPVLVASILSYVFVEKPFLRYKSLLASKGIC